MTGPEHYLAAERLLHQADEWMDADTGWKASLSADERTARRAADLVAAQAHAMLALAGATALGLRRASDHDMVFDDAADFIAWFDVTSGSDHPGGGAR